MHHVSSSYQHVVKVLVIINQNPWFSHRLSYQPVIGDGSESAVGNVPTWRIKPGVHTNDFAQIYGRRAKKLGHASLTTVFRHSRLTFQPILRENLESPLLRYQPITTAVVTDACLNTRWHHGIYIICLERVARYGSGRDNVLGSVGAMNAELSRPDLLATVQLVRKQA